MSKLPLIGYFLQTVVTRPGWLKAPGVNAIRSASSCVSKGPDNWINHWTHNEMWLYSTQAAARAVVGEADLPKFEMHAFRMLPEVFDLGERSQFEIPQMELEPLSVNFESIGFDAVSRSTGNAFECSPLSCNSKAEEYATNEHCLFVTLEAAATAAQAFSLGGVEPGPYYVVEVLRISMDDSFSA